MRALAAALEIWDASAAFSARSLVRCEPSESTRRFICSTATLSATTPARRIAPSTIQWAPLVIRRRLGRGTALGVGRRGRARGRPTPATASCDQLANLDPGAEPCRLRARVRRDLARTRPDRLSMQRPHLGLVPARADREVRRADAPALLVAQEPLHDPVLERVERDHREAAARPKHLERRRERGLERAELVVDRDAQRLEDPLRRMAFAEPRRSRDRRSDGLDEVE